MKTTFTKHEDKKQLHVEREFDAPVNLVWRAWTEPELLDQWWAPKPWKAETKSMDFREGGVWLYIMNGPEGEKQFCKAKYSNITVKSNYKATDAFCDEEGNENSDIPSMSWDVNFIEEQGKTVVNIFITYPSNEAMQEIIKMGFKEGFAMAHNNLDELLQTLQSEVS
ncbi:MAG: SRPBCC family protein [bacterium]